METKFEAISQRKWFHRRTSIKLFLLIGVYVTICAHPLFSCKDVFSNNYYVAPNGSDGNSGSQKKPWATVEYAARKSKPGDTIFVRGGTYQEGEVWLRADRGHGGAQGNLLTIKAYPNEIPVFVNSKRPFIIQCDYIRIEGLHFKNGKSIGAGGVNRTTIQLVNNSFTGSGYAWDAIGVSGNNILLEGNICDINGNTVGTQGHCYYISHGSNITIRNNMAKGMTGYGIHVFDQRRSEDRPGFERLINNVIIEGNMVSHSQQRSGIILAAYDHARIENVIIRNNVLFNNAQNGISIPGIMSKVEIYNNTLSGNGGKAVSIYGTTRDVTNVEIKNNIFNLSNSKSSNAYHVSNGKGVTSLVLHNNLYWPKPVRLKNVVDSNPITGDPLFVSATNGDFHLKGGSAAIDKGISLEDVTEDRDGIRRPQYSGFDIGAYEYH